MFLIKHKIVKYLFYDKVKAGETRSENMEKMLNMKKCLSIFYFK